MKTLTENQKEYILEYFFKNNEYAGWKNIANILLERGKCIVPGKKCIWYGGIGNFIKTSDSTEAVDCLLYTFDLDYFLTSEWFKEITNHYESKLFTKKLKLDKEYEDIINLK